MVKVKRNRYIEKKIRLRPDENDFIKHKMDNAGRTNFNAFALEMLIQGQVNIVDFKTLSDLKIAIDRVGKNINQIAKKVNESGDVSKSDIDETKNLLKEIENVVYQTIQTEYKKFNN
jgi:Bacterial mobilisation protein (MobC).